MPSPINTGSGFSSKCNSSLSPPHCPLAIVRLFLTSMSLEGTVGRGDYRNYYKGHMDKIKWEGGGRRGREVRLGKGGGMERKGIQL